MNDNVTLRVNGREWNGWTSVRIGAGIERLARDFSVEITRQWPGDEGITTLQPRIKNGSKVEVLIGDELVITGWVEATPVRYDARSVSTGIAGRSLTADLIDCAAEPTQFNGRSLVQIAQALAAPFGIEVVNSDAPSGVIPDVQPDHGETVIEVINKILGQQHQRDAHKAHGDGKRRAEDERIAQRLHRALGLEQLHDGLYGEGAVGVGVLEGEEGVIHQVHLEHRLLHRHQLDGEALGADDPELLLFLPLGGEGGHLLHIHRTGEGVLAQTLLQPGLVLAQLPLHGGDRGVDGGKHVGGALGHTDDGAAGADGQLHVVAALLHAEDHGGLRIRLKITV